SSLSTRSLHDALPIFDIDFFQQAPVLAFEPFDVARMLQGHGRDGRDGGEQMQVMFVQMYVRTRRVGINDTQLRTEYEQRHAQKRDRKSTRLNSSHQII